MNSNIYNIKNRFLNFIKLNNLIEENDRIVVGLSGGPDSVCLLSLLNEIKDEMNLTIVAAHINHMFRGKEADGDEAYARNLCKKNNIAFFSKKINVAEYAKKNKLSSESAGRQVRYDYFDYIIKEHNMNKIATAHNANDQAETVLMRLMRGTGLEGLGGILAKRDEKYIRPILFMNREEVEEYCNVYKLKPHIDKTNLQRIYSRNKIRLDIIPYMKENFNTDVVDAINRMTMLVQQDNKYIEKKALEYYSKYVSAKDSAVIISKKAFSLDEAIIQRIIRRAVKAVSGNIYDVEMKNILSIINLQGMETGKQIDIHDKVYATCVYGDISIKKKELKTRLETIIIKKNDLQGKAVKFGEYFIHFDLIYNKNISYEKNNLIKYFDYNMIEDSITIRTRKDGDKIIPLGMNGNKKIKDILIDAKIPREERDSLPIIQFDNDIAWLIPIKLSDKYKLTSKTKNILKITLIREV